ncbi:MAG TPA: HAD family hydrolase [Blastocatellia bacterium]|nr:HAD family hydrolase [Blastocatellia bacterium]
MSANRNDIKAIFFDAGGTLLHLDSSCIRDLLRKMLNIDISLAKFRFAQSLAMSRVAELVAAGAGSTEQLKREFYLTLLPETGVSKEQLIDAVDCAFKLAREEMLWRTTEKGTAQVLNELKTAGYILAVVSNSDGRIESAFKQAGINGYFDFFIDSYNVGIEKPDPEIFRLATEKAMVAPEEAAYVGDLYWVDVVGAGNAGLLPILYDPFDFNEVSDCLTIRSLGELKTVLIRR